MPSKFSKSDSNSHQPVASGMGDSYNAYYHGMNYFIYQQELKLMAGIEYFDMADDDEEHSPAGNNSVDG